ncbi:hypothetical protein [Atlantibacter hermannii]|uniref:hypothetical protein n=1 Tax=Atlantibacter hermannii TaxID=565 RepID=UPI0028A789EA|nr:hypothetical protein [Atlantibacter hermannii]
MNNWEKYLITAPAHTVPKEGTKAHRILHALVDGPICEDELLQIAGKHYRSPLQQLMNEKHGWLFIHDVTDEKGVITSRYLDSRHLSGVWELDIRARAERRVALKKDSAKKAGAGAERAIKAIRELIKAEDLLEEIKNWAKQNGTPKDAA